MTTRKLAAIFSVSLILPLLQAPVVEAAPSRAQVKADMDTLANQIATLDEQYLQAKIELDKVQSQIRDVQARRSKADANLGSLRKVASARAAAVYRAGVPGVLLIFLGSKDTGDFTRKMNAMSRVGDWEAGLITSLRIAQQRSALVSDELQGRLAHARSIRDAIASKRAALESKVAEQQRLLASIDSQAAAALRAARTRVAQAQQMPTNLPVSGLARVAVETAYAQLGKPYHYGAAGPDSFDCSGLMMFSWAKAGVRLPHSAAAQFSAAPHVSRDALQPGDIVFFGSPIHHDGMYIGGGNMIHAPETGDVVKITSISRSDYVGASRPGI
jgi:peptidoglycan DL-endopeptidase CwlO